MSQKSRNIILIGMPSCGKSTIGVLIAKELGLRFIDSDLVIQEQEGRRLHEIIKSESNEGFLRIEEKVNLTLGCDSCPSVIATGGSAIYSEPAMLHFKEAGTVVYLKLSYRKIKKRLGNFTHRGVVMPEGYTLKDLYDERCRLCERYADITVDEDRFTAFPSVVKQLCSEFEKYHIIGNKELQL